MSDQTDTRNLRLVILSLLDWGVREQVMRLRSEAENDSTEHVLLTSLLRAVNRVDLTRDQMNDALSNAESRIAETRRLVEQGQMLNDSGMLQCNPDQRVAAFESAMRAAVDTLRMVEKVLGREVA